MWSSASGVHHCTGLCICSIEENDDGDEGVVVHPECPVKGHTDWVNSVSISADGKRFVSGSDDKTARIWDVETGAEVRGEGGRLEFVTRFWRL